MDRPRVLVLHRTEWERLQKQGGPLPEEPLNVNEYLKALTEQSQEWMRTWPDTVAGHVAQLEKQKKDQLKANIAFMKAYASQKKQENTREAIKEAKKLIFRGSSYGRKLLSALLESKAIEVREKQIKFNKELQQKAVQIAKDEEVKIKNAGIMNAVYDNDAEREKVQKLKAVECVRVNKEMLSQKKKEEVHIMEKEKQDTIEDKNLIKKVIEIEKQDKERLKQRLKQSIKEYETEKVEIDELKAKEKQLDKALRDVYKKGQDGVKCKMQSVLKDINHGRPATKWSKDLYKKIEGIHREQKKHYDDFIDKGIQKYEKRVSKKETKDMEQEKQRRFSRILISQENKIAAEEEKLAQLCANKCHCDKQSILLKTTGKANNIPELETNDVPIARKRKGVRKSPSKTKSATGFGESSHSTLSFLAPRNQLLEDLKKREKEPTPWTGAKGAHAQFAQEANAILKEVKHKHFARKVVDEYRKYNCLDANTLPIPYY